MMEDRHSDEELAKRLLSEDGLTSSDSRVLMQALIDHEISRERFLRRAAVASWSVVLTLVLMWGCALYGIRARLGFIEAARAALPVISIFGILALFLAVLTTMAWLFRSRSASLAIIERRLAALEELLKRSR
jgi:fumarate reductase subunit C